MTAEYTPHDPVSVMLCVLLTVAAIIIYQYFRENHQMRIIKQHLMRALHLVQAKIGGGQRAPRLINAAIHKSLAVYAAVAGWWKYRDPYFFRIISLEISTDCNRKCGYCPLSVFTPPKERMADAVLNKAIADMMAMDWTGIISLSFYNEPLKHPDLVSIVTTLHACLPKCLIRIFTNGDYLTMELADKLIAAGVTEFALTIHDAKGEPTERARRRLQPVVEAFPHHILVGSIHDNYLWNRGGAVQVKKQVTGTSCTFGFESLVIAVNGDLVMCCNDFHKKHTFGNIMDKPIMELWRAKPFTKLRTDLRNGIVKLPICRTCLGLDA